jgi:excisionase family DNA binding protein
MENFMLEQILKKLEQLEAKLNRITLQEKKFLDIKEAAEYSGYSVDTLRKYHSSGKIKATKPGGKNLRFTPEDLSAFLASNESKTIDQILKENGYKR